MAIKGKGPIKLTANEMHERKLQVPYNTDSNEAFVVWGRVDTGTSGNFFLQGITLDLAASTLSPILPLAQTINEGSAITSLNYASEEGKLAFITVSISNPNETDITYSFGVAAPGDFA